MSKRPEEVRAEARGKSVSGIEYGLTKVDDTSEGFTVDYVEYGASGKETRRTVTASMRPLEREQMKYAHEVVSAELG